MNEPPAFPGVHLSVESIPQVMPVAAPSQPAFPLPPLGYSQLHWLTALAQLFYRQQQRCLAVLLMLETSPPRWALPVLPFQRCSSRGAAWQLTTDVLADRPRSEVLAGSFQVSTRPPADAPTLVPPYDGLHLVYLLQESTTPLRLFLRCSGQLVAEAPHTWLMDDWQLALERSRERMMLQE